MQRFGFSLEPSPNTTMEATFTPDGKYVIAGSGDGNLHAWNIEMQAEVAQWSSNIEAVSCLKWAPRRAMFAAASSVLTFWIPNFQSNGDPSHDAEAPPTKSNNIP